MGVGGGWGMGICARLSCSTGFVQLPVKRVEQKVSPKTISQNKQRGQKSIYLLRPLCGC